MWNYILVFTDSKREDEDPKWNIHKCDLGLWKQTTKDQFSNVQLNDDQNLEHTCTCMYQQFEDNFLNYGNSCPKNFKIKQEIQKTMLVESRRWREKTCPK